MRATYFFIALFVFLGTLLTLLAYYYLPRLWAERHPYGNWEELLNRLSKVNREKVALVALSLVDEFGRRREDENETMIEESQIWSMIGGIKGLEILERNCAVLVDLVYYVQQWYPEALAIAEQLRLNAREIEWHIGRLKGAANVGRVEKAIPEHARKAIILYYAMTRRVLTIYEELKLPELGDLRNSL